MNPQQPLNLLRGLPDDRKVMVRRISGGGIDFFANGTASFATQLRDARPWNVVWVGPGAEEGQKLVPGPIVNYIADPDICGVALGVALENAARLNRPWFNHPKHVLHSTRDRVSTLLQGISGLDVPRTIRTKPESQQGVTAAIREHAFRYPVLVRVAGLHGGETLTRLDDDDAAATLRGIRWGVDELYLTEFRDFAHEDGLYRKWRLAVVGGRPFIRHVLIGTSWLLHAERRLRDERATREEGHRLDARHDQVARIRPVVEAIHRRLKLDYFGLDCSILEDGSLVLFEANACMDILKNSRASPNMWDEPIDEIKSALLAHLDHPELWAGNEVRPGVPSRNAA